jgi:hypothetical protein
MSRSWSARSEPAEELARRLSARRWPDRLRSALRTRFVPGRRLFLKSTAVAWLGGLLGIGCGDARPSRERGSRAEVPQEDLPDSEHLHLLGLVAGAVLPSELGAPEHRRIAASFSAWLDAYDPTVEPAQRAAYSYDPSAGLRPYPRSRIDGDLREIELLAERRYSRSFGELELVERQELLRGLLDELPATTVQGWIYRQDGHVALGLLDFYYHFAPVHGSRLGR